MNYTFASATILLILITDPIGNIPIFANALKNVAPERRARVILREVLIAFLLLLAFMFVGQSFLKAMSLSDVSLQIGGAVVLFLIALRMLFPPPPQDSPVPVAAPVAADDAPGAKQPAGTDHAAEDPNHEQPPQPRAPRKNGGESHKLSEGYPLTRGRAKSRTGDNL